MSKTIATLFWLLTLSTLSGCAHVERVGFDTTRHSLRYCGNRHADEADVKDEAKHECSLQHFAVLSCNREQVGAKASTVDYGYGISLTNSRATYGVCCDVECEN